MTARPTRPRRRPTLDPTVDLAGDLAVAPIFALADDVLRRRWERIALEERL